MALAAVALTAYGRDARGQGQGQLSKLVGQTIVTGFTGLHPDRSLLVRIRAGQVGGVLLFGDNIGSERQVQLLTTQLQHAAALGGNPPLLVAVDQEGGMVKRLAAGPPELSPASIGQTGSALIAEAEGVATGSYLRQLGFNVDLAPVLDTPSSPTSFLGTRAYSGNPMLNAALGSAFVRGLQRERVAATGKHFPGLGTAPTSTDGAHVLITTPKGDLDRRLRPFRRAIAGGVKLIMVSNAGYTAYDSSRLPAVIAPAIVTGLLRGRLGFRGVVISDSMEAPGPSSRPDSASRAVDAGVDALLYTRERDSAAAFRDLLAAAGKSSSLRAELARANARIGALKQWLSGR